MPITPCEVHDVDAWFAHYVDFDMLDWIEQGLHRFPEVLYPAPLALLCYTEFLGGLSTGLLAVPRNVEVNFQAGLALLDRGRSGAGLTPLYTTFQVRLDGTVTGLYNVLRCGMVHEFFAKGLSVVVTRDPLLDGVGWHAFEPNSGERFFFNIATYLRDFRAGVQVLREQIKSDGGARQVFEDAASHLSRSIARLS